MRTPNPEVFLDDPQHYPQKDWCDRDVLEPEDLNSDIFVWEVSAPFEDEPRYFRSRHDARVYANELMESLTPNSDGSMAPLEHYQVVVQLTSMPLGDYIAMQGN